MFPFRKKTPSDALVAAIKQAKYLHRLYVEYERMHGRPWVPGVDILEDENLLLTSHEVPHKETELVLPVDFDERKGQRIPAHIPMIFAQ